MKLWDIHIFASDEDRVRTRRGIASREVLGSISVILADLPARESATITLIAREVVEDNDAATAAHD